MDTIPSESFSEEEAAQERLYASIKDGQTSLR
jgi:hypothetical protein